MHNYFLVPLVIHTRGVVMIPCAQALNFLLGRSLCLLRTCKRKAWNLVNFISPRVSLVDVTTQ